MSRRPGLLFDRLWFRESRSSRERYCRNQGRGRLHGKGRPPGLEVDRVQGLPQDRLQDRLQEDLETSRLQDPKTNRVRDRPKDLKTIDHLPDHPPEHPPDHPNNLANPPHHEPDHHPQTHRQPTTHPPTLLEPRKKNNRKKAARDIKDHPVYSWAKSCPGYLRKKRR